MAWFRVNRQVDIKSSQSQQYSISNIVLIASRPQALSSFSPCNCDMSPSVLPSTLSSSPIPGYLRDVSHSIVMFQMGY